MKIFSYFYRITLQKRNESDRLKIQRNHFENALSNAAGKEAEIMKEFTYTITQQDGIHGRPAVLLVKAANAFPCKITLQTNGKSADAKGIFSILSMAIQQGDTTTVVCSGEKETEAAAALQNLFRHYL